MSDKGQNKDSYSLNASRKNADISDFVLDKAIFSKVFEKDIRRVYLYKKAERLAKAIHLVAPAFSDTPELKKRLERIQVGLIDSSVLPPSRASLELSREILALSSILGIARTTGMLTAMNADLIAHEAQNLLLEVVQYEAPRLTLDEVPSLATLAKASQSTEGKEASRLRSIARITYGDMLEDTDSTVFDKGQAKGHVKDSSNPEQSKGQVGGGNRARKESILAVLKSKGPSYIKDISLIVRDVSEKTIQRELSSLVSEGLVVRKGDRRWTTYELAD